jgi:hypothetical protein
MHFNAFTDPFSCRALKQQRAKSGGCDYLARTFRKRFSRYFEPSRTHRLVLPGL